MSPRFIRRLTHHFGDRFQLNGYAGEPLRERVVNLSSYPIAFREYRCEARLNLSQSKPVQSPPNQREHHSCKSIEPVGLVKARLEMELERRARLVPYAIIVRGDHSKLVTA